ncbi:probable phosphoglycerate mutase [Micromonospora citrea]|uniref:Probable phosphoglycerate mutase n=1 Tax=Micromonospora citrea TaxID=47855 RepID=A0A1C6TS97_9ACTN|nr:histidine phosphatase family protein [Micromonospora citrea]SCL44685.1 probable phosphoglycerate mutase [Micromonospora citrea]
MRFVFLRHGRTAENTVRRISTRRPGPSLDATGRRQAALAGRRLAALPNVVGVVTSPLRRAVETATIVAAAVDAPMQVAEELAECDAGEIEGRLHDDIAAQIDETWHRWLRLGDLDHPFSPAGECARSAVDRVGCLLERLDDRGGRDDTIVLVGHGTLFRIVLPHLCVNLTPEFVLADPGIDNVERVEVVRVAGSLRCESWRGNPLPEPIRATPR